MNEQQGGATTEDEPLMTATTATTTMTTIANEKTPLRPSSSTMTGDSSTTNSSIANEPVTPQSSSPGPFQKLLIAFMTVFESILGFAPFIAVMSLQSSFTPDASLGAGAFVALFVIFYSMMKEFVKSGCSMTTLSEYRAKLLDVGQFLLFFFLSLLAYISEKVSPGAGDIFVFWFNSFTNGGMALIMYTSIVTGRPFVYDEAKAKMPPALWQSLSSKKWFLQKLEKIAWFWTTTLTAMTAVVTVQPILVTIFFDGDVNNDPTGTMATFGSIMIIIQFMILFYALFTQAQEGSKVKKRVCEVRDHGLSNKEKALYGAATPIDISLSSLDEAQTPHRIKSLVSAEDIDLAATVLVDAYAGDAQYGSFLKTDAQKQIFFSSSVKAVACFNHVLACYDGGDYDLQQQQNNNKLKPAVVMACIPVYSKSQEELNVFFNFEGWLQHGFVITGATATDFTLPDDKLIELGEMKSRATHGLTKQPYIYIAYFGADSAKRGKGYGRSLLKYIIELSESKKVPLVLETNNAFNIRQYEKYGFKVVDRVKDYPNLVLMVRSVSEDEADVGEIV